VTQLFRIAPDLSPAAEGDIVVNDHEGDSRADAIPGWVQDRNEKTAFVRFVGLPALIDGRYVNEEHREVRIIWYRSQRGLNPSMQRSGILGSAENRQPQHIAVVPRWRGVAISSYRHGAVWMHITNILNLVVGRAGVGVW